MLSNKAIDPTQTSCEGLLNTPLLQAEVLPSGQLIVFKLDYCLFAYGDVLKINPAAKNVLTQFSISAYKNPHYGIQVKQMADIFHKLLAKAAKDPSISISFITQYKYDSAEIKLALQELYNLPPTAFHKVAFLRYGDFENVTDDLSLIKAAQRCAIVPNCNSVTLVTDNQPLNETEAELLNVDIIRALVIQNPKYPRYPLNNHYIDLIISKLNLPIMLTAQIFTPLNDMRRDEATVHRQLINAERRNAELEQKVDCLVCCLCCQALSSLLRM